MKLKSLILCALLAVSSAPHAAAQMPGTAPFAFVRRAPVAATITITGPASDLDFGATIPITWTSSGVSGSVSIYFSSDGGSTWSLIASLRSNTGSYFWSSLANPTTQGRVKVQSENAASVFGTSGADFAIRTPTITVTSPVGSSAWPEWSSQTITYTTTNYGGAGDSIRVRVSSDGGLNYTTEFYDRCSVGSCSFVVPAGVTTTASIQLGILADSAWAAMSPAGVNFTVTGGSLTGQIIFGLAPGSVTNANFGGLAGADTKCNAAAAASGLAGSFKALLSTSAVDAKDRVTINGNVYNVYKQKIANNAADLWDGTLDDFIRYSASKEQLGGFIVTGSNSGGTKLGHFCGDWTDGTSTGTSSITFGLDNDDSTWMNYTGATLNSCADTTSFYCLQI